MYVSEKGRLRSFTFQIKGQAQGAAPAESGGK
jgi:hypothetical protein